MAVDQSSCILSVQYQLLQRLSWQIKYLNVYKRLIDGSMVTHKHSIGLLTLTMLCKCWKDKGREKLDREKKIYVKQ